MDAHRAADVLGIPFYVWDFSERFKEDIVDDFIAEYAAGRTPNPCMRCNERIKFAALLDKGLALGFDAIATGHYAEVKYDDAGNPELHRGNDMNKDQSYVLGVLTTEQLKHSYFPIGVSASKADVRAEAAERDLSVANKPDSYDICFIPDGDTKTWLADKIPMRPGAVLDQTGEQVGTHDGATAYTVGQRRGLQLGRPAADGQPRYVLEVKPEDNTVVVGPKRMLAVDELKGIRTTWCGLPPSDIGEGPDEAIDCLVQVRAHGDPVPAHAWVDTTDPADAPPVERGDEPEGDAAATPAPRGPGRRIVVRLEEALTGVAPGQTAVLYRGTRVLGQATIDAARALEPA